MAVAFGAASTALAPATSSSYSSNDITPSGSNLVVFVGIQMADNTATVTSVTWSVDSAAFTEVKNARSSGTDSFCSIWVCKAPTAGTGHAAIVLSASVPHQTDIVWFTGADQTTPSPVADAVTNITSTGSITVTPTNLTANDGTYGGRSNTVGGDVSSVTPHQTFLNDTTAVNGEDGYALGTTGVTLVCINTPVRNAAVGARIVAAATSTGPLARLEEALQNTQGLIIQQARKAVLPW